MHRGKPFGIIAAATVACLLAAVPMVPASAASSSAAGAQGAQLVVSTSDGELKGTVNQGAREFLGVPYAAPPVDDLRLAPPQAVSPWTGVRPATTQGPACIQFQPSGVRNAQATSEDCLYLDVYTPQDARQGAKLPVIFFIHGGGGTQGSGVLYGGQRFATLNDAIFVSINYRLGAYGELALPQLDGSGDFAFLDQLKALKWVAQNIAAFGGDPGNVTIDGQSAGSTAVCDMLASPMAKGLFQRAVLESTPCNNPPATLAAAEASGKKFAADAGCANAATIVGCLRAAWTPNLVAVEQKDGAGGGLASGTPELPLPPLQAIEAGKWNKVPILVGSNRWEYKLLDQADLNLTAAQYTATIDGEYGANATAVLAHYPLSNYQSPFYAIVAADTDAKKACPSYWLAGTLASQTTTWEEEFNDPTSPTLYGFQPPGIDMSSAHSAELAYLWNFTLGYRPLTSTELNLGMQMDRYWGAFARGANPNVAGQVGWPAVTTAMHPVIDMRPTGNSVSTTVFTSEHQCGFWATVESAQ